MELGSIFAGMLEEFDALTNLGLYWRNPKKDPVQRSPCCVFRYSLGQKLALNNVLQMWKKDPWNKTYGMVVIFNIIDNENCFTYGDYTKKDFENHCAFNTHVDGLLVFKQNKFLQDTLLKERQEHES